MQYHGSHPQHQMKAYHHPPEGTYCSICKGSSNETVKEWYACVEEECDYVLCWKCFEVDEQLFDTIRVIIRNPFLSHEDMSVNLRTRPRDNAHVLSLLCPGQLMMAVSCVKGTIDPNQTYYRLKSGGWVNAAHVVSVIPSQELIEGLAKVHVSAHERRKENLMPLVYLLACIEESFRLMDERSPYGPLMASLTLFPVVQYSEKLHTIPEADRTPYVRAALGFVHYIFYFALDGINEWFQFVDYRIKTKAVALHVELLAKSVIVVRDLALSQIVEIPAEFGPLLTQTVDVIVALMPILECGAPPPALATSAIRAPSLVDRPTEYIEELMRLNSWCFTTLESVGWLLQHIVYFTYDLNDIRPLREAIFLVPNSEILQRTVCQVATSAIERTPSLQRNILDLDVLEVALSLAKRETCAESQMAVCKLISSMAHNSPRNISQIALFAIPVLCQMGANAWNSVVAGAVFDSFAELAFNDPRADGGEDEEAFALPACSAALHPHGAPYQLMNVYDAERGRVAVCEYCRATHPPGNKVPASAPQFAFFRCQCAQCHHKDAVDTHTPLKVPTTPAIQAMLKHGVVKIMLLWLRRSETTVTNAIGRLSLKMALPVEVTLAIYRSLLHQSILLCSDAALAVAAQAHLPAVKEMRREYPNAPISQYLSHLWAANSLPDALHMTPGQFSHTDEDGLSPSPDIIEKKSDEYLSRHGASSTLMDFLTVSQKIYLDDVL